jgi:predicted histidine transporter YuiF (NhaC family)
VKTLADSGGERLHHHDMSKILVLLVGVATTWGLVTSFGLISIALCFALALGTLIFSTRSEEDEIALSAKIHGRPFTTGPTTRMSGL